MYDKKIFENLDNSMKSGSEALLSIDPDTSYDSLITTWERISNENVQCLNKLMMTAHLTMGEKSHILTTIAHLKDDAEIAFNSRIKTGIITNLQHKD
ncbi:hypothetical protein PV325_010042 [Microctonus aethiopoides]|nr:hypothetical protein PV325_010042 [Microctonus aethiopoides]KAK0076627.1 hypothetical protein PV326_010638 [Microctonus aethiopoides]